MRRTAFSAVLATSIVGMVSIGAQPASAVTCAVPPTAVSQSYTVPFGKTLRVNAPGLLTGATGTSISVETSWQTSVDPSSPSDDVSEFAGGLIWYGDPSTGLRNRKGGFTYTPDPDADPYSGDDYFYFTVTNPCGDEDYAEADITIVPKVVDATYSAFKDTPLTVPAPGFLSNDQGVDPGSLQYDFTSAMGGSVDDSFNSDGSFVYTPPPGYVGPDSFAYTVDDLDQDNTYPATVHITVFGATTAPAAPTSVAAVAGSTSAKVSWKAPPPNGLPTLGYTVVASPGGKTVTASASPITFKGLNPGGSYTFKVRARNSAGTGRWSAPSKAVTLVKAQSAARVGYWMLSSDGTVYGFGSAKNLGHAGSAVAIAPRRDGTGYWTVDAAGNVSHFGTAGYYGGRPPLNPGETVSTMSATPSAQGYWLFTNRGRAFGYGNAAFHGDLSGQALNGPIIASVATPTGKGYYMVGSDGGVFTFGDARFHGSTGGMHLNRPIVGIAPTPDNRGYWLVASDGGVFAFNAPFRGSMGGKTLTKAVNGLVAYGNGYLMVASDGGVFDFSNRAFLGSLASNPPSSPVIGIAAFTS